MGKGSWAVKGEQRGHRPASLRKDVFGGHVALQVPSLKSEELGKEGTSWARALGLATSSPPRLAFLTVPSGSVLSLPFQLHHTHGHRYRPTILSLPHALPAALTPSCLHCIHQAANIPKADPCQD